MSGVLITCLSILLAPGTDSERTALTHPVPIHSISVGKPGHVAIVLDTVDTEGHVAFGRDVMVFGHNAAYQLGTGKRSNLCVPQHLHPLPPPTPAPGAPTPENPALSSERNKLVEADLNSGALTHMPVSTSRRREKRGLHLLTLPFPASLPVASTIAFNLPQRPSRILVALAKGTARKARRRRECTLKSASRRGRSAWLSGGRWTLSHEP